MSDYTALLQPFTICLPAVKHEDGYISVDASINEILNTDTIRRDLIVATFEAYASEMLAAYALGLRLTPFSYESWPSVISVVRKAAPSLKKRTKVVDRRRAIWRAIQTYCKPILPWRSKWEDEAMLAHVQWELYLLALATKQEAQVKICEGVVHHILPKLRKASGISREGKARLAMISGVFEMARQAQQSVSALSTLPNRLGILAERIDEILEDAYLLEASALKRFLGRGSNIAAVKRDLRLITRTIVKRSWAKGVIREATTRLSFGIPVGEALGGISELIASNETTVAPVIQIGPVDRPQSGYLYVFPLSWHDGTEWGTIIHNDGDDVRA
jgi:hypothetical protein